ncbi:MAG: amidohydrolase family protein [Pseudomonadota bacterium]
MYDLIIRNGTVVDGTGAASRTADVAIKDGLIAAVGEAVAGDASREIDAAGQVVTPGWVDIHTHYDGQATWDDELGPSAWHGVTTLVMGNCGVGFAPAKPDRHDWLIGLMEGVEDIPGAALSEGITWGWESFGEYLDVLEQMPRSVDIATHIPHGAVRAFVMGERGANNEAATPEDIAAMADIVADGIRAGALGFSTSRTMLHLSKDGVPVPGTFANRDELIGIGRAMLDAGGGVFEMASDLTPAEEEFAWMKDLSRETGLPVTYALLQNPLDADNWKNMLAMTQAANDDGANVYAQIAIRPTGLVLGWESTVNPFSFQPSYAAIAELPMSERLLRLRDPAVREAIISEEPDFSQSAAVGRGEQDEDQQGLPAGNAIAMILAHGFDRMFRLADETGKCEYEPAPEASVAAKAKAQGVNPRAIVYDMLMENAGRGYVYLPLLNYTLFNFDHVYEMLQSDRTVLSLSDGGAHCGVICDASFPTYLLTHWVRDRSRGRRISLEAAVKRQCHDTARLYGMFDRGTLEPGMRADVNVIDFDALEIAPPEMAFDLPAGGRRMIQRASGYRHTFLAGVETFTDGVSTGAKPGGVVRGPQRAPGVAIAAE